MTVLMTEWCNPYGVETGGAARLLGGLSSSKPFHQWACKTRAIGHFRMTCEHGHKGQMMPLCDMHAKQFKTRDMTFCPRCNAEPPGHKCKLSLTEIS
jgi:hypothetical protein